MSHTDYDPVHFSFRQQITDVLNAAGVELAYLQRDVYLATAAPETAVVQRTMLVTDRCRIGPVRHCGGMNAYCPTGLHPHPDT